MKITDLDNLENVEIVDITSKMFNGWSAMDQKNNIQMYNVEHMRA